MVANACLGHLGSEAIQNEAYWAGLLHDLGKYHPEWQDYLRMSASGLFSDKVPHAHVGAYLALRDLQSIAVAHAIAAHHTGLVDPRDFRVANQADEHEKRLSELLPFAAAEINNLATISQLTSVITGASNPTNLRRYEFYTRFLFSVLVDADRLDAERHKIQRERPVELLRPIELLTSLKQYRKKKADDALNCGNNGPLFDLRNRIFDECLEGGKNPQGFFTLTVPTGGAKTLAMMAFALGHALKHKLRRVIIVIPYLSIIEQNALEYRRALGDENVTEHHSATIEPPDQRPFAGRTRADLAAENWDAPVIVTTIVQFIESLLGNSPRRCRKLHNIARSVVVFDEAQALPHNLLAPVLDVFRELVNHYGVSMLFSTATQPPYKQGPFLIEGFTTNERMPVVTDLTNKDRHLLRRVRYHLLLKKRFTWKAVARRLTRHQQVLCVVNIRRHARVLWRVLQNQIATCLAWRNDVNGVLHLSTHMCAAHRNVVLEEAKRRLKEGRPCWLVSTQCIEAGVDIDFPVAYRALGPLDSIVQVAGRCNREGKQPDLGDVYIFRPRDPGMPQGVYKAAADLTLSLLRTHRPRHLDDPKLLDEYFNKLTQRAQTDRTAKGLPITVQAAREQWMYETVAASCKVIVENEVPVFVPYGDGEHHLEYVGGRGKFTWSEARQLQRYIVNVAHKTLKKMQDAGKVRQLLKEDPSWLVLDRSAYHNQLGVLYEQKQ